jgi:excisionase family DNA binding protein
MLYSMNKSDLTTSQAAARLSVGKSTVNLWCRQGRFPGAYAREEARGNVWYIPESDVEKFDKPKMGRPPKVKAEVSPNGEKPTRATKKGGRK